MSYTVIKDNQVIVRHLAGNRTLAEILTQEESEQLLAGKLMAVSKYYVILTLSSPLVEGDTIKLCTPTTDLLKIFKNCEAEND